MRKKIDLLIGYLILFFPIYMILGAFFLNLFSIIMSFYALIYYKNLTKLIISKEKIFFLIVIFFIFIFPYNSINFKESFLKYISYFRCILMFFGIIIYLNNLNNDDFLIKIKKNYVILVLIISLDVLKEFFTGTNFLGFGTDYTGRIASFTNDELIIGYIFAFLTLFSFGSFKYLDNKYFFFLLVTIIISFLIGERSNFLKLFSLFIIFSLLQYSIKVRLTFSKIIFSILILILLSCTFFLITKNTDQGKKLYNLPFVKEQNYSKNGSFNLIESFYNSKHAPHYLTAYNIFLNYPLFGIGINNFYEESKKQKYDISKIKYSKSRSSTHPHQIHLEILSEVGLLGFLYFEIIFLWSLITGIIKYLKNYNQYILGHIMLHIFFIFPILPSGSFFGTNYGLPFWFNLSILIFLIKKK